MKIFPSACPFHLVNGLETTSSQYKFNPFPDWDRLLSKKEYVDRTWSIGSLSYYFILFRTWETKLRKRTCGVLFLSFFKLSKHERDWVIIVIKLIKTSNSNGFTFTRLVKTSHSDGFTRRVELYNKHMLSSSSLIKNKEVLVSND